MLHWMTQNIGMTVGLVVCLAGCIFLLVDIIRILCRPRRFNKNIARAQDTNLSVEKRRAAAIKTMEL